MRRDFVAMVAIAASLTVGAGDRGQVFAAGYWNMPGTLSQRAGHGYSGGYHAPFILGPIKLDGWGAPNEVRLPCAPAPTCCCCSNNCDCGRMLESPSMMEGKVPTTMPLKKAQRVKAAKVEPLRPLFDPPVPR